MNDLFNNDNYPVMNIDVVTSLDMTKWKVMESWSDISKKDIEGKVEPIPGIEYYVKSFHTNNFEQYHTTVFTSLQELMPFKKGNRIYTIRK